MAFTSPIDSPASVGDTPAPSTGSVPTLTTGSLRVLRDWVGPRPGWWQRKVETTPDPWMFYAMFAALCVTTTTTVLALIWPGR